MGTFLIAKTIRNRLKEGKSLRLSALPEADGFYQHLGMEETGMNHYGGLNWRFSYKKAKEFSDFIYNQLYQREEPKPKAKEVRPKKPLKKLKPAADSLNPVRDILRGQEIGMENNELLELTGFKHSIMHHQRLSERQVQHMKEKGTPFWPRNAAKLKADFLKNMNPANYESPEMFQRAKERMKAMPVTDFAKVLAAIMSEEDEA
jgi:hypothetical protein